MRFKVHQRALLEKVVPKLYKAIPLKVCAFQGTSKGSSCEFLCLGMPYVLSVQERKVQVIYQQLRLNVSGPIMSCFGSS